MVADEVVHKENAVVVDEVVHKENAVVADEVVHEKNTVVVVEKTVERVEEGDRAGTDEDISTPTVETTEGSREKEEGMAKEEMTKDTSPLVGPVEDENKEQDRRILLLDADDKEDSPRVKKRVILMN